MKIAAGLVLALALFLATLTIYGTLWVDPEPRVTQELHR